MKFFTVGRLDRELSTIEMALVLILVSLLVAVFVHRVEVMTAHAERTKVSLMLTSFRQSLQSMFLSNIVRNDDEGIAALHHINPFLLMDPSSSPSMRDRWNYLGELDVADIAMLPAASWYYDRLSNELVYVVENNNGFISDLSGRARIRIKTRLQYEDNDNNGGYNPGDAASGIRLAVLDNVVWHEINLF